MANKLSPEAQHSKDVLKPCFIITPIGSANSDIFKKADGLIKSVIRPILNLHGFEAVPAYEISSAGSITKQVIEHVINDELVIANLTGINPNVMYELALRHAYQKKVISMAERGTLLPFDISDQRTVFYEDSLYGSEIVKPELEKAIIEVLTGEVKSNPVIDSIKEAAVINAAGEKSDTKYLLDRFDRLERMISNQQAFRPGNYIKKGNTAKNEYYITISDPNKLLKGEDIYIKLINHSTILSTYFTNYVVKEDTVTVILPVSDNDILDLILRIVMDSGLVFEYKVVAFS